MTDKKITVLKFGGSVLRSENDLPLAVHEIYRHWRRGSQVLAVVSAFGGVTDELLERARSVHDDPHPEALATLLLTGEATSAAMLGLALKRSGVPAKILTPEQVGILTAGDPLDAEPVSANIERLQNELGRAVVIVSGFAGVKNYGDLTLLGRGGTDYTALFLSQKLNARCVLVKDVDGMYESNPADTAKHPKRFSRASYETTLRVAGELVQPKAVRFAEKHGVSFQIAALGTGRETTIGDLADTFADDEILANPPLRVALLGCGIVGGGVYQRLLAMPDKFEITGVVNLDPNKALAAGIDKSLLARNATELIESDCDVVIELIGGLEPARTLIKHALKLGRHVITANKALLAGDGYALDNYARQYGVTIRYSASVGGALPALEAVAEKTQAGRPKAIKGIINGTCNFICDQLADGNDFTSALSLAQRSGFAEADPTLDIDGTDAAQKLILLIRASFGISLPFDQVERIGIDELSTASVQQAKTNGRSFRLVAECRRTSSGVEASVRPLEVPLSHPFALTKGAENCLLIEWENGGTTFLRGQGAGRHATTESVIGDLFDLRNSFGNANGNHAHNNYYSEVHA